MDTESQKKLNEIAAMDINSMTEADAAFLRARSAYLSEDQRVRFAEVLRGVTVEDAVAQQPAEEASPEPTAPSEAPKKKSGK